MADVEGFPLGHLEDALNVNEKQLVSGLFDNVLGGSIEVELVAGDSQFESAEVFGLLESHRVEHVIAWRRLKGRVSPPDVLTVKDRIDVDGPEYLRSVYLRLRATTEGLIGRVKCRLGFGGSRGRDWITYTSTCVWCFVWRMVSVSWLIVLVGLSSGRAWPSSRDGLGQGWMGWLEGAMFLVRRKRG